MHKKLMLACMAVAAFAAFVIAPAASASPALTEGGSALAVGSSIKWTNTAPINFTFEEERTFFECTHTEFKGTLTKNNGSQIKGEIPVGGSSFSGTGFGGDCTSPLGGVSLSVTSKLCWETVVGTDNVKVTGCGGNIKFSFNVTGITTCKYLTSSISGTFKTNEDATVNWSDQPAVLESSVVCPSELWLDVSFDLTTTDGTTLSIS